MLSWERTLTLEIIVPSAPAWSFSMKGGQVGLESSSGNGGKGEMEWMGKLFTKIREVS